MKEEILAKKEKKKKTKKKKCDAKQGEESTSKKMYNAMNKILEG